MSKKMLQRFSWQPAIWLAAAFLLTLLGVIPVAAAPAQQEGAVLPAPIYFIDGYSGQIVRLDADGQSRRTISYETVSVTDFDVAPDGSKLVYVAGNQLIEVDARGAGRILKFDGGDFDPNDAAATLATRIAAPVYSPDGARIAFSRGGVNLIASGADEGAEAVTLVLSNEPYPAAGAAGSNAPVRFYSPRSWSPDGVHLLVDFFLYQAGSGLAILAPDSNVLVELTAEEEEAPLQGDVAWKLDSIGFYIGSDRTKYDSPGLSLVDAGTGVATPIISAAAGLGSGAGVQGPHVKRDGGLWAFVAEQSDLSVLPLYAPAKIEPANGEYTPVGDVTIADLAGVLWAADDSGAVLLSDVQTIRTGLAFTFQWLFVAGDSPEAAAGSTPITLSAFGSSPRWGSNDFAGPSPAETAVVELFEQSLDLAGVRSSGDGTMFDNSVAFPIEAGGTTYWIAHTTGLRSFNPDTPHAVGVYVQEDGQWREVSLLDLVGAQEGVTAGPDYLNEAGVTQVEIGPGGATTGDGTQFWLLVEGGAGAHSGVCAVLRLADDTLTQELDGFSSSPGACTVQDVNGDGINEVVLDATDYYVFCYACGVRFIDYGVQRWDGRQFVQVKLEALPAAAPDELSRRNDELLRLVQGGLWKAALDLLATPVTAAVPAASVGAAVTPSLSVTAGESLTVTDAITGTGATTVTAGLTAGLPADPSGVYAWNVALVQLIGDARRQDAQSADHPYPLLAQLFYGDYPAAVDVMGVYSASELFVQPSTLVSGTVAEGWESELAGWITTTATSAIAVNPQLADAYFVRGWGQWLSTMAGDSADEQAPVEAAPGAALEGAVADIRRALELAPDGSHALLFAEVLSLLTGEEVAVPGVTVNAIDASPALTPTGALTPTAAAPFSGAPGSGRLLYSTMQDGQDRIYLVEFGAANATLTQLLDQARQPALQPPDGQALGVRLAFQSTQPDMLGLGGYDLTAGQDPNAAGRFNFTTHYEDSLPRWNPAGNRLVFSSLRYGDGRSRVYTVWADTISEAVDLGEGSDPDWSPDGSRLVYKGCDESGAACGLWTMAIDGTDRRPLTNNPGDARPRWTPDGSRVVFMSDQRDGNWDVYSVAVGDDFSGGDVTRITFNAASDGLPAVSPDGSEIVFISNRGSQWGIWRVGIDSGRAQSVVGDLGALPNWLEQSLDWAP